MSIFIKSLNKSNSKFSVNGKLCVLLYGPDQKFTGIKYSSELSDIEEKEFKSQLEVLNLI